MALKRSTNKEAYGWSLGSIMSEDDKGSSSYHWGGKSGLKEDLYFENGKEYVQYKSLGSDYYHKTAIARDINNVKKRRG